MRMITHWNDAIESLAYLKEKLEDMLSVIPHGPEMAKYKNTVKKAWDKVQRHINEVDKFITPPDAIEVKIPAEFNTNEFIEAWQYWKDYLEEQHAVKMRSRMELKSIKHLAVISGKDVQKAVSYLDYAEHRGAKNFFKIDNINPEKEENYDPDFSKTSVRKG